MPEALARARHDAVFFAPARDVEPRRASTWALLRTALPTRAKVYAIGALAVVMTGIVLNALILQRERHPSPLFAVAATAVPAPAARTEPEPTPPIAQRKAPAAEPAAVVASPPSPPVRPVALGATNDAAPSARASDPIAYLLRASAPNNTRSLVAAAQGALVKLGYSVKTGGAPNAETNAALREFEKSRGLPLSTEVTPRLVKLLNAAATASAAR